MTTSRTSATWLESYDQLCAQRQPVICSECKGDGQVLTQPDNHKSPELDRCPTCGGSGFVYEESHAQTQKA